MSRLAVLLLPLVAAVGLQAQEERRPARPERPQRPSQESKPADPYKDPAPLKPPAEHPGAVKEAPPPPRESGGWRPQAYPPRRGVRPGGPPRGDDTSTTLRPGEGSLYPSHSRSREQARAWERGGTWRGGGAWGQAQTWQDHRARDWAREHRGWRERGGYGGYIIPEHDFRLHFGPERGFRLHARPVIRQGYPCFAWGGYTFLIVDPWPEFWTDTWYAEDDLWIDWADGYYLHSRRHPGFGLALTVTF